MELYKVDKSNWLILDKDYDKEPQVFQSIEKAADYMEAHGVPDGEIDMALIDMLLNGNKHSHFGINGAFVFSDNVMLGMS